MLPKYYVRQSSLVMTVEEKKGKYVSIYPMNCNNIDSNIDCAARQTYKPTLTAMEKLQRKYICK
jgi:hypothetical protein